MRICYDYQIFSARRYGGISRYFVELAAELSTYPDVHLRVVSPLIGNLFLAQRRKDISVVGIDISQLSNLPLRLVKSANALLFLPCTMFAAPDILHETFYERRSMVPKAAKIVTTIHDTIPERFPQFFSNMEKHREEKRRALRRADHVICVSESTRQDLLELYDVEPGRVSVVPLGSSIEPASEPPADLALPYFLHVGGRYEYKNFGGLVQAFGEAGLYRTHKLVSFSVQPFGARELGAMDRAGVPRDSVISATGDDHVLARYYAGAEALVFPSMYEGFGIPLLEAMRCGCPIITSNVSSLPEVAGDAAVYCDPLDIKSISAALLRVATSPETRASLIAKGRARAKAFSWKRCAADTYKVYKSLADV